MLSDLPIEKRFSVLCDISRAQHFAWREAVRSCSPGVDTPEVVLKMWEVTGIQTGRAYAKRLDPEQPLPGQLAASIVWSSHCMGEDAAVEPGSSSDEAFVRHAGCPWFEWHKRLDLLAEDQPGCDRWFQSTVDTVNEALGTKLRVETLESLPEGAPSCLRRFWIER